jgi:hypothetical protein
MTTLTRVSVAPAQITIPLEMTRKVALVDETNMLCSFAAGWGCFQGAFPPVLIPGPKAWAIIFDRFAVWKPDPSCRG